MSATIDERVVEMKFNNKDFEQNAKTSISTIERLKQALNFTASSNGLDNIAQAAKRVDMNSLGSAVDSVKMKFSALQVAAVTALSNIVNRAVNAGLQIANSFAIQPISDGFNEYEMKLGSIQTILANTQSQTAQVSQTAINDINNSATQALAQSKAASKQSIKNLQSAHNAQVKALQKSSQAQLKAYSKETEAQMEAFEKKAEKEQEALEAKQQKQLETLEAGNKKELASFEKKYDKEFSLLEESSEKQLDALNEKQEAETEALEKAIKEETKTLQKQYNEQYSALEKAQKNELKLLKQDHNEKLDMYHEEYMEKLKATDEERYNRIKQIDDEIDSINALTESEDKEREAAEQRQKIAKLEDAVRAAETVEERREAEEELAEYKAELERKRVLEEREAQIQQLEAQKKDINEQYDLVEENLKAEYEAKKENENNLYEESCESMKEEQELQRQLQKELYTEQLEALQEQQKARKKALQEQQADERNELARQQQAAYNEIQKRYDKEYEALAKKQEKEKEALEKTTQEQTKALNERQKNERKALSERREAGQEALQERQEAARDALNERQSAEMSALEASHQQAIANIESEKKAKIAALNAAAAAETKPTTLEDVNAALSELNDYADQTIYSFADMTRNIGTFTAAGVDLDTSVNAIKGIANLAALSGSSSQQASTAMYQLSQAIATGSVKLMDWNSIVNAGMGGKTFQNSLIETARVHGVAVDDMIAENGSFRDSLQEGWLTSEILLETLSKFTGDLTKEQLRSMGYTEDQITNIVKLGQTAVDAATKVRTWSQLISTTKEAIGSGWAETFELIFGDFDEATELWTGINNVVGAAIDKQSEARNELLRGWKEAGGRDDLIKAFANLWKGIQSFIKPIQQAFRNIFPPTTSETLVKLTKGFKDMTSKFKLSSTASKNLKDTFSGLFAAVDLVFQVVKSFVKVLSPAGGVIKDIAGKVLSLTGGLGTWITDFDKVTKKTELFSTVAGAMSSAIKNGYEKLKTFFSTLIDMPDFSGLKDLKDFLLDGVEAFANWISKLSGAGSETEGFSEKAVAMKEAIEVPITKVSGFFDKLKESVSKAYDKVKTLFTTLKDFVKTKFQLPNVVKAVGGEESEGEQQGMFSGIVEGIKTAISSIKSILSGGTSSISNFFTSIKKGFKSAYDTITKIASKFKKAVKGIIDVVGSFLSGNTNAFSFENVSNALGLAKDGALTVLILNISNFLKKASKNVGGLTDICDTIKTVLTDTFGKIQKEINSKALINIAASIAILAASLLIISNIPVDKLVAAGVAISALFADLTISMKSIAKSLGGSEGNAVSIKGLSTTMIAMSGAILLLAAAVKKISSADIPNMAAATVAIVALIEEMARIMKKFEESSADAGKIKKSATTMLSLAGSVLILSKAVEKLGQLKTDELVKGTVAVSALLGMLAVLEGASKGSNFSASSGVGILAMAGAMLVLQQAVSKFGEMDFEQLKQGAVTVSALIGILGLFENIAGRAEHGLGSSVGTIAVATSLIILLKPLKELGQLSLPVLAQGLIAVGVALGEFAVAARLMDGAGTSAIGMLAISAALLVLVPVLAALSALGLPALGTALIGLAGAFTVIGVASALIAPYADVFVKLAGGITLLGVAVAGIGVGILAFSTGLATLAASGAGAAVALVAIVKTIATGVLETINESLPLIVTTIKNLILSLLQAIAEIIPEIAKSLYDILSQTLSYMIQYIPDIVSLIMEFLTKVINTVSEHLPELVKACVNLVAEFFSSITEALRDMDTGTLEDALLGAGILGALFVAMAGLSEIAVPAMTGIAEAGVMIAELTALLTAIGAIAQIPGLKWLIDEGGELLASVGTYIGKFAGSIVGGLLEGVTSSFPQIATDLSNFMKNLKPFINGTKDLDASAVTAVGSLASMILKLTAADLLSGLKNFFTLGQGGSTFSDFADELEEFGPSIKAFSDTIKGIDSSAVKAAADSASVMSSVANNLPKHGGAWQKFIGDSSLSGFANELKDFGPAIKSYSKMITSGNGIDATAVESSAKAASILSDMASTLQRHGGVLQTLLGDKSLSTFATELKDFGPAIKSYSDSITKKGGIDSAAVESSANAALALATLAKNIPANGGFLQTFLGEQDLGTFGTQISGFGTSMKKYSDAITKGEGFSADAVTASANAAQALVDLANNLPKAKGVFSFLTGENDLASFGENLKKFGESFKGYYDAIRDINTVRMSSAISAISSLIQIAKDTKDLDTSGFKNFGKNLKKMGDSGISKFVEAFETCESVVNAAIETMISYAKTKLTNSETSLNESGKKVGSQVASGFKSGLGSKNDTIQSTAGKLGTYAIKGLRESINVETIQALGAKIPTNLGRGMSGDQEILSNLKTLAKDLADLIITAIDSRIESKDFYNVSASIPKTLRKGLKDEANLANLKTAAQNVAAKIISGISKSLDTETLKGIGKGVVNGVRDGIVIQSNNPLYSPEQAAHNMTAAARNQILTGLKYDDFVIVGQNVAVGLHNGMVNKTKSVSDAAYGLAKTTKDAMAKGLRTQSPSKVTFEIGQYVGLGLANGMLNKTKAVASAGKELTDNVINPVQLAIDRIESVSNDIGDFAPTITPVLDLSQVSSDANQISSMFRGFQLETTTDYAQSAYSSRQQQMSQTQSQSEVINENRKMMESLREMFGQVRDMFAEQEPTNTFNITSNDPRGTANEVNRILQQQVVRRKAAWGK